MDGDEAADAERPLWSLAEIAAACLRVMILNDPQSGIDTLKPYVRQRIAEAADILDDCSARMTSVCDALFLKAPDQEEDSDG